MWKRKIPKLGVGLVWLASQKYTHTHTYIQTDIDPHTYAFITYIRVYRTYVKDIKPDREVILLLLASRGN